jgi:hypothetical protein
VSFKRNKLVAKGCNDSEIRYLIAKVREKSSLALFETRFSWGNRSVTVGGGEKRHGVVVSRKEDARYVEVKRMLNIYC